MLIPVIVITTGLITGYNYLFEKIVILGSEICGAYKVNRMIRENHKNEIPIFGSSRAEGGFIPDILGKNYFNYGMSGTQENVIVMLAEEECKKNKQTPILINFDLDGVDKGTGEISNYLYNSSYPAVKQLLGTQYRAYYSIPILKYYGQYELYAKYFLNDRLQLTKYTNKGASVEKNVLSKEKFTEYVEERKKTVSYFKNDPPLREELLNVIKAHPERFFVFVIAPYHESYFENFRGTQQAVDFIATINSFKNAKVFDFSKVQYPDDCYLNSTHLNYKGAMIFNATLRDSLRATGITSFDK